MPRKHAGIRPITGAEVTLEGGCARTLLCESGQGLREPLPDPHRRACRDAPARAGGPGAPAARRPARDRRGAERGARLPLRLRARRARRSTIRTAPRGSPRRSAASGSSSSCSGRTSGATRGATRCSAISPSTSASRRSPPATSTPMRRGARCSRTCSSRSAAAPRSTAASGSGAGTARRCCAPPAEMVERFAGIDRAAAERTGALAERLTFDLTEELGYRYPDFSDRADPAIRQLAAICDHAFGERYGASDTTCCKREARARLRERARADRGARARGVLPPPPRGARARAGVRARGAGPRLAAHVPAAGAGTGQLGRLDRLLPDRALARRPGRERPLARAVPEPASSRRCRTSTSTSRATSARS